MQKPTAAFVAASVLGAALTIAVAAVELTPAAPPWDWKLPKGFPPPDVPADNPMTAARVELGRHLFYDLRLSGNGTQSCASCHQQDKAFTDGMQRSVGSTGETHPRGSMSLVNVAYARALTWANPTMTRLEEQAMVPMFGHHPVELGLDESGAWLERIERDETYRRLFAAAFPESAAPVDRDRIAGALAAFQRSIVSARSPYDRYYYDRDENAISEAAKRGSILFHSQPLSCFTCHGGLFFSGAMGVASSVLRMERPTPVEFHNTGLYNLTGELSYPRDNLGIYEVTHASGDVGKFKVPTLRNVAVTAPYMHDGSVASLEEAIDHYAAGGRTLLDGPYRGVGHDNPNKARQLEGFTLTAGQRADLVAFLESLTDEEALRDPQFADPWSAATSR